MSATKPTPEEAVNARHLRQLAISEGLPPLTDFEYLQHAIVAKENTQKAISRIRRLHAFKEQYNIRHLKQKDVVQLLKDCDKLFPNFFNGMGIDSHGRSFITATYKNFDPSVIRTQKHWNVMMSSFYYLFNVMNFDLDSARAGIAMVSDAKEMSWANFSLDIEKRMAELYQDSYPTRMKSIVMLDAPIIIHAMVGFVKVFLSKKVREAIKLESSNTFLAKGEMPQAAIPKRLGGIANDELKFKFIEEHLSIRTRNEAAIKLD